MGVTEFDGVDRLQVKIRIVTGVQRTVTIGAIRVLAEVDQSIIRLVVENVVVSVLTIEFMDAVRVVIPI